MTGKVRLYHGLIIVQEREFSGNKKLKEIMDLWKKLYGKGYNKIREDIEYYKPRTEKKKVFPKSNFKKGDLPKIYKLK